MALAAALGSANASGGSSLSSLEMSSTSCATAAACSNSTPGMRANERTRSSISISPLSSASIRSNCAAAMAAFIPSSALRPSTENFSRVS